MRRVLRSAALILPNGKHVGSVAGIEWEVFFTCKIQLLGGSSQLVSG